MGGCSVPPEPGQSCLPSCIQDSPDVPALLSDWLFQFCTTSFFSGPLSLSASPPSSFLLGYRAAVAVRALTLQPFKVTLKGRSYWDLCAPATHPQEAPLPRPALCRQVLGSVAFALVPASRSWEVWLGGAHMSMVGKQERSFGTFRGSCFSTALGHLAKEHACYKRLGFPPCKLRRLVSMVSELASNSVSCMSLRAFVGAHLSCVARGPSYFIPTRLWCRRGSSYFPHFTA